MNKIDTTLHSAASRKLPSFLCIGMQKSGTTWLYENLALHPHVWMPKVKELMYFGRKTVNDEGFWREYRVSSAAIAAADEYLHFHKDEIDPGFVQYLLSIGASDMFSREWYERVYSAAPDHITTAEVAPEYFHLEEAGIQHIQEELDNPKIVVLLRDPVERAWSQVRMVAVDQKLDPIKDFYHLLEMPEVQKNMRFQEPIDLWRKHIAPENIGFFNYHQLNKDANILFKDIQGFLGLEVAFIPEVYAVVHKGKSASPTDEILFKLKELCKDEYRYLATTFGEDWQKKSMLSIR